MVWSEAMNHAKSHFLETLCVSTRYQHRDRIYFNPERTMKSVHVTIVAVVFTALISGCAPSAKDKLVGKWQGTVEVDNTKLQQKLGSAGSNPFKKALAAKMIEMVKQGTMEFDLKADDSFSSSLSMGLLSQDTHGTWKVVQDNGNQITLELTDHKNKIQQSTLTFADDGSFEIVPEGEAGEVAIFRCRRVTSE
ncbi:MAG TPA: hypothetical protein DCY79_01105 [Planctomycetaceae bacterium]|nr:hypothetical protein [Blastopirellula sp.]HAY78383.1 hypothetical protein [Planctomycetaceae bacterium]|tara:strand:+ start:902 stop:1480 length:579 start_codon:yes stop_codon:yes gene_type:complete